MVPTEQESKRPQGKTKADTSRRFRELLEDRNRLRVESGQKDERILKLESELAKMQAQHAEMPKQPAVAPDEWYLGWSAQHMGRSRI
jgi:hypothetical protein